MKTSFKTVVVVDIELKQSEAEKMGEILANFLKVGTEIKVSRWETIHKNHWLTMAIELHDTKELGNPDEIFDFIKDIKQTLKLLK
jgi:hypothetical protein